MCLHNVSIHTNFHQHPVQTFSSLTLSMPPYLFSLLFFFSLSLFSTPPLPSIPLNRRNNHPTSAADKKILTGNSCFSFSYFLSMPLYLFTLSCSSYLFLFFHIPPYIGLISTLCLFIFSLSLVLCLFAFF